MRTGVSSEGSDKIIVSLDIVVRALRALCPSTRYHRSSCIPTVSTVNFKHEKVDTDYTAKKQQKHFYCPCNKSANLIELLIALSRQMFGCTNFLSLFLS